MTVEPALSAFRGPFLKQKLHAGLIAGRGRGRVLDAAGADLNQVGVLIGGVEAHQSGFALTQVLGAAEPLTLHWATPQKDIEDAAPGTVLLWIDPPAGVAPVESAAKAERAAPAGPISDPEWDNPVLDRALRHAVREIAERGRE
jgi:hypothetical protein